MNNSVYTFFKSCLKGSHKINDKIFLIICDYICSFGEQSNEDIFDKIYDFQIELSTSENLNQEEQKILEYLQTHQIFPENYIPYRKLILINEWLEDHLNAFAESIHDISVKISNEVPTITYNEAEHYLNVIVNNE